MADSLQSLGIHCPALRPGQDFQPAILDVPTRPTTDFLWAGLYAPVVSGRVRSQLLAIDATGVVFCRVITGKVGRRSRREPIPISDSHEPEDLLTSPDPGLPQDDVAAYWEMVVTAESGLPPGIDPADECRACGHLNFDSDKRRLVMMPEMWPRTDVFYLATTSWVLVSDRVKDALEQLEVSNARFLPASSEV